jgi:hypothetical protein
MLPGEHFDGGDGFFYVRLADLDRDGAIDAVAAGHDGLRVLSGDGKGHFAATSGVGPPGLDRVELADVNTDGHVDAVALSSVSAFVRTYIGLGDGTLHAQPPLGLPSAARSLAIGRFDADVHVDLALGETSPPSIRLALGDGTGLWTLGSATPLVAAADQIFVEDLDQDGDQDCIVRMSFPPRIQVLLGDGGGGLSAGSTTTFNAISGSAAQIDVDLDGRDDVVLSISAFGAPRLEILRAAGNGQLQPLPPLPTTALFHAMEAGDLDQDGAPDLACISNQRLQLYRGLGGGSLSLSCDLADSSPQHVALGDVDGDGFADVVQARGSAEQNVGVFLGDRQGGLISGRPIGFALSGWELEFEDFDLDGDEDLAIASGHNFAGLVSFYAGDGRGNFGVPVLHDLPPGGVFSLGVGRVDVDPYPDAVVGSSRPGPTQLLRGGPNGLEAPVVLALPAMQTVALGDANGDELADLFRASGSMSELRLSDGTGGFGSAVGLPSPHSVERFEFGDIDRDGDLDVAIATRTQRRVSLLAGDGQGQFTLLWTVTVPDLLSEVAFIDEDGDLDDDVVVILDTGEALACELDAQAALLSTATFVVGVSAHGATVFDLDADGYRDLVCGGPGMVYVMRGSSTGLSQVRAFGSGTTFSPRIAELHLREIARPWVGVLQTTGQGSMWLLPNLSPPSSIGETYCTSKINSLGCAPRISAQGTSSASAASGFVVRGVRVSNHKSGVLLYGASGRRALPFQGGVHCVGPPTKRTPVLASNGTAPPASDCSGVWSIDLNAFATGALGGSPGVWLSTPGTVIDCQFWGRDPGFAPPNDTSLTNALEYSVGP